MSRTHIFSFGSTPRVLGLVASLALACGDDGSTTATDATTTLTTTAATPGTTTSEATESATADVPTTAGTESASGMTATTSSETGADGGFCAHQCSADADCMVGGADIGLTCQDSFCAGETAGCSANEECVAQLSGWTMACTSGGGECDMLGMVCVQAGDGGACATPPSDFFMCETVPGWAEIEVNDIDGNPVTVCGNASAECHADGYCFSPCQSDADCASEAYPVCDTNTGVCGCGSDDHCATLGQPQSSVCNAGTCGCGTDQHCVDGGFGDVCTGSGACGCSGDAACAEVANTFDGGTIACVNG